MDIFSIALPVISDNVLLCAQLFLMSAITGREISKSRHAVSILVVLLFDLVFNMVYGKYGLPAQYTVVLLNNIKLSLLSLYILQSRNISHALILQIFQSICALISAEMNAAIHLNDNVSLASDHILYTMSIRLCFLVLSIIIKHKTKSNFIFDKSSILSTHIYVMIIIVVFIENGLVDGLTYPTFDYDFKIKIIAFLLCLLIIFTTILIISLTVNTAYKSHYLMLNSMLKDQVKSQLSHYEKMEQVNREIRRFRHDYNNHINCIVSMIKSNRNDEALGYINNMSGKLPDERFIVKTGNYIADAILADKQGEAEKYNIELKFEGCIISDIDSTDLCIILSNALDNAIEACCNIPGSKSISVYGGYQHGCFVLIVKNPAKIEWKSSNGLPASSKKDSTNHGLGLSNIKFTVQKYNGTMEVSAENGVFTLGVSFNPFI